MLTINYLTVLLAAVATFIIGFLWHGPLFGKQWMKLSNISAAEAEAGKAAMAGKMWMYLLPAFLQQLVMAYVLAHFVYMWGASDIISSLELAFWIWLGFIATVLLNGVLWEKRTVPLYLFNIVYHFVSLASMTIILAMWK